ncbi:MAG: hypothetical protein ABEJ62_00345 [Candidatus Nanohaloarchaea archaeon]
MAPVARRIARDQGSYVKVVDVPEPDYSGVENVSRRNRENGVGEVEQALEEAVRELGSRGTYLEGEKALTEGVYVSLIGVPHVLRRDPVESGGWNLDDPGDRDFYMTDLPYGDFNDDGRIDAAVGRYPANRTLAWRMYNASEGSEEKTALVASEYLHANWPVILTYLGGGMWTGKSVEHILEDEGFNVSRAVEYRAEPEQFLVDLTPVKLKGVLSNSRKIQDRLASVLGGSVGAAASHVYLAVKALNYVERGLQQYLEFDWSTFGLDMERAEKRISDEDMERFGGAAAEVAGDIDRKGLTGGIVESLKTEGVQAAIAEALYAFFWPDRYPRITEENLVEGLTENSLVYYNGVGNGSAWILPNNYSHATSFEVWKTGRYNGSKALRPWELPGKVPGVVFDNSDTASRPGSRMMERMLERGVEAFVGTTSVNYAPFSSEVDTRFFKQGETVGQALRKAVNGFRGDSLTWAPYSAAVHGNVKSKMAESFVLYGNPERGKDPVVEKPLYRKNVSCREGVCELSLSLDVNYSVVERDGERGLTVESNGRLLRSFRPIIPLLESEYVLPEGSEIIDRSVSRETRRVENVSVPSVIPVSHGGSILNRSVRNGPFPENWSRLSVHGVPGGGRRIDAVHAAYRYRPGEKEAVVAENIMYEISYRAPVEMEVRAGEAVLDRTVDIEVPVTSSREENFTAEAVVEVRNRTSEWILTENVTVEPGENLFNFSFRPQTRGKYEVEAFLSGPVDVGPRTEVFTVRGEEERGVELDVSAPESVREGERFRVEAVVVNNADRVKHLQVRVGGSEGVQTGFLRSPVRELSVEPRSRENVSFRLRVFGGGAKNVTVSSSGVSVSRRLEVEEQRLFDASSSGPKFSRSVKTPFESFRVSRQHGTSISLRQKRGRIKLVRSENGSRTVLDVGGARAVHLRSGGRENLSLSTDSGRIEVSRIRGESRVSRTGNGVGLQDLDRYQRMLEREREKLLERFRMLTGRKGTPFSTG